MARRIVLEVARICGAISCHALTHFFFALDGLAMNLEKGYRPAGDLIIEDADYQPTGIPSLCIEVCPTFYRDWTIPELVMPVHDMSRSVTALIGALVDLPQQLVRILRSERQIRIDAGVHIDPMPVDVHQRERGIGNCVGKRHHLTSIT